MASRTGTRGSARRSGSTASWESYVFNTFQITVPTCANASLNPTPASGQPVGTSVAFTASSTDCSAARYQFLVQAPGGPWRVVQAFSSTRTFTWDTTGLAAGDYQVAVWVQATGSVNDYDVYTTQGYNLN